MGCIQGIYGKTKSCDNIVENLHWRMDKMRYLKKIKYTGLYFCQNILVWIIIMIIWIKYISLIMNKFNLSIIKAIIYFEYLIHPMILCMITVSSISMNICCVGINTPIRRKILNWRSLPNMGIQKLRIKLQIKSCVITSQRIFTRRRLEGIVHCSITIRDIFRKTSLVILKTLLIILVVLSLIRLQKLPINKKIFL